MLQLHRAPPAGLSDAGFDAFCDAENERLDGLFAEAQRIARENPQWFTCLDAQIGSALRKIIDTDEFPTVWRGQAMRVDRVPDPVVADEFVRMVYGQLEWEGELQQTFRDVALRAEDLRAMVSRKLTSFTDFRRNGKTGLPENDNPDNVRVFLQIKGIELRWNAWFYRQEFRARALGRSEPGPWAQVDDALVARLMTEAGDSQFQFRPSDLLFRRTLETVARENQFDPIVDHLASLQWDGVRRLSTWLSRACGVAADPYHQAVGRNVIGGIVKRALRAGAKHDEVMLLIGLQGTLKSSLCRTLAWQDEFFTDSVSFEGSPQNIVPQLFGKLVVELSELDGMANRETSYLKAFISRQSDNVTLKYEKFSSDRSRRCIFIGTSNDDKVLRDATGNRRFLPVRVNQAIDVTWVRDNLDQLLAEAVALEASGTDFSIPAEVWSAAASHQEAVRAESDFEMYLNEWFGGDEPGFIMPSHLATLLREAIGRSVPPNRYGATMKRLGFDDQHRKYVAGKRTRVWLRGDRDSAPQIVLIRDAAGRHTPRFVGVRTANVVPFASNGTAQDS